MVLRGQVHRDETDVAVLLLVEATRCVRIDLSTPSEPQPAVLAQRVEQRDRKAAGARFLRQCDAIADDDETAHAMPVRISCRRMPASTRMTPDGSRIRDGETTSRPLGG